MRLLVLVQLLGSLAILVAGHIDHWERLHREPPIRGQPTKIPRIVETKWIRQKVDNFDPQNPSTWSMRYMENAEHYQPGGPLFIYVGGEWTISAGSISRGHFYDMAKELGAYLFYTEHRYYGLSRPTASTRTDLLKFLNIDQALADLAYFVEEMKNTIPGASNAKIIMAGGSYSATMVAWFRQKYPHLINGAWASSAPLLAKLDFVEYKEVVSESIRLVGGDDCANRIDRAYDQIEDLLNQGDFDKVREEFLLCDTIDFTNKLDTGSFLSSISNYLAGVVQYHQTGDIEGVCEIINDESISNDMTALAKWFTQGVSSCMDITYASSIRYYVNTDWNHGANRGAMRPWTYQTCAEYGWYQTSGSENQIFGSGFPVDLYIQICADLYDNMFTETLLEANVARTNVIYGHMQPAVTNVFFTHGQLDPWRPMGLQEDLNEHSPAVVIPLASHCADLSSISADDSPEMRAAKERVFELIQLWLGNSTNVP
ncbi:thymus-specific serine protease-like [Topomyia yanbarensis]|uniref:thymus-specific serine protease-like n=1 Tax=Topomyia yanbarensis TaxID=2498891 RepID=UPI00273C6709|nr:thymus-specific serine protease-like [Topomyia yanbarensis]